MRVFKNKYVWLYLVAFPILLSTTIRRCATLYSEFGIEPCLADEYMWCGYYPKDGLIILSAILFIVLLKEHYRVAVLIRYNNKVKLLLRQCGVIIVGSALTSIYYVGVVTVLGLRWLPYECNWEKTNSMAIVMRGSVIVDHLETYEYGLILLYTTFFTVMMVGTIMMLCWWLIENPVAGLMVNLSLLAIEVGAAEPYVRLYYSIVDVSIKTYANGIDNRMFILPYIYIPILWVVTWIVICRKDYLKLK